MTREELLALARRNNEEEAAALAVHLEAKLAQALAQLKKEVAALECLIRLSHNSPHH